MILFQGHLKEEHGWHKRSQETKDAWEKRLKDKKNVVKVKGEDGKPITKIWVFAEASKMIDKSISQTEELRTKDKAQKFLTQLHSAATVLERTLASLEGSNPERKAFMLENLGNASEIIHEAYKRYKKMTMPSHNWEYEDLAEVRKMSSGDAKAVHRIMASCRI